MLYDLLLTKHTLILVFPEHTFSFTGFGWDDNLLSASYVLTLFWDSGGDRIKIYIAFPNFMRYTKILTPES
ncbi:hypothetical protein OA58_22975 [Microcystis aeruginosa NIES-88]|nr:hypothetical protein OA58_22975 [Microcystis aeruginosa NIES-88]